MIRAIASIILLATSLARPDPPQEMPKLNPREADFNIGNFFLHVPERKYPKLRSTTPTLGKPVRDHEGRVTNAVLILHGTGGAGHQFAAPAVRRRSVQAGRSAGSGQYFLILPDDIGHGASSKPSDGMHMRSRTTTMPTWSKGARAGASWGSITCGW